MSMTTYDVGDVAELKGTFTDPANGDPVDPDTVVCTVRKPNGSTVTPTVEAQGDGVFVAAVEVDRSGTWTWAMDGTGGHKASGERTFRARTRAVPR